MHGGREVQFGRTSGPQKFALALSREFQMKWQQQSRSSRLYLLGIYACSIPLAVYCLTRAGNFGPAWFLLTLTSAFVATINVRLPKISLVISMGDVFVILCLLQFGPGPALITYWIDIATAHVADVFRKYGVRLKGRILWHRFLFNLGCCALSVNAMAIALMASHSLGLNPSAEL